MKIKQIAVFLLVFSSTLVAAQTFDPSVVKKSLVRVKVSIDNSKSNVCTGFVWKSPNQIVTSLHAMHPDATGIQVLYLNEAWRKARIKKVLLKADLVLLEILPGEAPVPSGVVPIMSYSSAPVQFGTEIFAMGYNNGATGSSSRTLKKGFVEPETLDNLVPAKDKAALARIGFPALDLHILYLEGSLLPGYSGAPVFDPQGRLIGIGDGGLEKGASNVSWLIPAAYLSELENSASQTLPSNFPDMAQLFSAEIMEEPSQGQAFEDSLFYQDEEYPEYSTVVSTDFEFWLTKNRSLDEMSLTSDDPEKLYSITDVVEEFKVILDYDYLRFDIFEDINYGVVLAVPEGEEFYYDSQKDIFQVDYSDNPNVDLQYMGWAADYSQADFQQVIEVVLQYVPPMVQEVWAVGNFTLDPDFSTWMEIDEHRKIANILLVSDPFFDQLYGGQSYVYLYITLLMSYDKTFMGIASFNMSEAQLNNANTYGVDCRNYSSSECAYFENMIKVFCAAHLTTFAY